ncbi:MAG: SDR family oxidoreductase [Pseudobdellovibrionaceae bacterium]
MTSTKNLNAKPVVLITGVSRGIGHFLATEYLSKGFEVVGCSRGPANDLQAESFTHIPADITVESEVTQLFSQIRKKFGRLDVAINNAAVNPTISLSLMTSMSSAMATLQTNVLGTFVVSRESAKLMMRGNFGRIINFSSMAAKHEVIGEAIYSASKSAVHSMTRVMAKEFYQYGITCNVVAPSAVQTHLMSAINTEALHKVLERNAIPQIGRFEDISNTIDWLIKPESQSITGQIIYLGGA